MYEHTPTSYFNSKYSMPNNFKKDSQYAVVTDSSTGTMESIQGQNDEPRTGESDVTKLEETTTTELGQDGSSELTLQKIEEINSKLNIDGVPLDKESEQKLIEAIDKKNDETKTEILQKMVGNDEKVEAMNLTLNEMKEDNSATGVTDQEQLSSFFAQYEQNLIVQQNIETNLLFLNMVWIPFLAITVFFCIFFKQFTNR